MKDFTEWRKMGCYGCDNRIEVKAERMDLPNGRYTYVFIPACRECLDTKSDFYDEVYMHVFATACRERGLLKAQAKRQREAEEGIDDE